ncbi:MAG: hypothetical protein KDB53_01185, partial [Planctomycetes bacterium]|nr:hypothetical protein [Planctomycetota bacterium]
MRAIVWSLLLGCIAPSLAVAAAPQQGLRPDETSSLSDAEYPGAETLDADDSPLVWVFRVLDEATGQRIPDAVVRVPNHIEGGAAPQDIFDRKVARADADGWIRIAATDLAGWRDYIVADAPGFAPNEYCLPFDVEVMLTPGTDVAFVLLDYLGRPVSGASVGYNRGCGHIPDQRRATTDARGRGILRSIDPRWHRDIFIEAPGLHAGPHALSQTGREESPPVAIHASPGITVEGRLSREDGSPWVGAKIGLARAIRPWALSDAEGSFRLVGVARWGFIEILDADGSRVAGLIAPPEGTPLLFRRGPDPQQTPTSIRLRGPRGEPAGKVLVAAVRTSDGRTSMGRSDEHGTLTLELPEGRHRLIADGELGVWGRTTGLLEVRPDEPAALELVVPLNPVIALDVSQLPDATIAVTTATQFRRLDP